MAQALTAGLVPEIVRVFSRIRKRIPLESGNYPYATARARAKKSALLSKDTYARMLQMEIPQIARLLSEGGYKAQILALAARVSGVDLIELATSRNLAAVFSQIIEFSEGELRQMIGWYLDRFDVQNIKTIVRGKLFGATPAEVSEDIVAAGSMRESFLESLIQLSTLEEVFERLEGTIYAQALETLGESPAELKKWNQWEDLVTKLYYENLLAVVPERTDSTRAMREWVRREVDIVNLKTLLRLWAQKVTLPYDPFIEGGYEFPKEDLAELLALDANALAARLREYPFAEDLANRLRDLPTLGLGNLVRSVEKVHLLTAGRQAHVHPLSVLPILDYIVRKEREVQNLRIIARGKESGLPPEVIRELLVV
jgi:V/A-type H+-transporting ATPase subunit C